ncbi:hypothetical protein JR065_13585 [Xanthomonas sp. AmX2]|nr:hypothetical protein [Xanthomonas sp.]MBN6151376.1 hypothetical protein [Xanthomonas sp.]
MRELHQASLQALPPQTLARLRAARHGAGQAHAASAPRRWGWLLAATPAVLGAAFGLHLLLRPALPQSDAAAPIVAGAATPAAADPAVAMAAAAGDADAGDGMLEENPDLYLWLGSETSLAME